MEIPIFLDPSLLRAAQRIYRNYCGLQNKVDRRPCGVAINRDTYRGQLIFRENPILLPRECFIPLKQLEAEVF
ncbi:hypothetical protein NIES593_05185 [Hydrococcus rivularis NIES-593]|uniref:Uncharacterized protein n=1 Tax=Hydrococcus rivularis NIES-593 TaxID=1921803 RepID=A0A1U7HNN4_9CYAN|nr:hypothetical protein NIES593_05185 [Hydrococcus rivularis NIES-593]